MQQPKYSFSLGGQKYMAATSVRCSTIREKLMMRMCQVKERKKKKKKGF
jgi:hypothetical protein